MSDTSVKKEHRLYDIEKWKNGKISERHLVLCTASNATWYSLQGWDVFDMHESLNMDSEWLTTVQHDVIISTTD